MQVALETYNYLKFSSLSETQFWDYYTLSKKQLVKSKFPLVKLSDVLIHRKGFITIDDNKIYKRCRAQIQAKGVVLRDEIIGKEIKTKKQQVCKSEDFLVAEIDAKVGGYGIIPPYLDGAIVSGHYFLFEIEKEKLLPEFLGLVVKHKEFSKQVKSTGSTNYSAIRPYHVLEYQIPLPSLPEQHKIVEAYHLKLKEVDSLRQKSKMTENGIAEYLFDRLGIKFFRKENSNGFLTLIEFNDVERWSVDFIQQNKYSAFIKNGKYPPVRLKDIIAGYQYGLSEKASTQNIGVPMLRMNNIFGSELLTEDLKYIPDKPTLSKFILDKGDLLFNRTNSKELVGKTAVFYLDGKYTFASYLIRVKIDKSMADVYYINYLFNSPILQFQKDLVSRQITGQANINAQEMQDFLFPLPPLTEQKEIAKTIKEKKEENKRIEEKIKLLQMQAELEFEKQIFY